MRHAHLGQGDRLVLLVDDVVAGLLELRPLLGLLVAGDARARLELRDDLVDPVVLVGRLLGGAADDERGPRLVDEDRVHLVHHREVVPPLDVHAEVELHVVAQVVEAELVVRPVGDVGAVGLLALAVVHAVLDDAHGEAQEAVEPAHPLGVALGQVVVDGDHVDALAGERVQVGGQGGDEGLALARLHLRDHPAVQHHPADELDVEVAHVEHAPAALAHDREGLGQQVVEARALREPLAELDRLRREGVVVESSRSAGSNAPIWATTGRMRFSSRSFLVPTMRVRMALIMCGDGSPAGARDDPSPRRSRMDATAGPLP